MKTEIEVVLRVMSAKISLETQTESRIFKSEPACNATKLNLQAQNFSVEACRLLLKS